MRVTIKNEKGKLYAVTPIGQFRLLHSYVRKPVYGFKSKLHHMGDSPEVIEEKPVGIVVCVEVDGELLFGFSKVKEPDHFSKQLGLTIAAGKALTRPLDLDDFPTVSWHHPEVGEKLMELYNRSQRYLRPLLHD
jgi:hypothetical protein